MDTLAFESCHTLIMEKTFATETIAAELTVPERVRWGWYRVDWAGGKQWRTLGA
jgi:hypothetical protein